MLCRIGYVRETSPGTHTFFPTYDCPIYCWRSVQLLDFDLLGSLIRASQPYGLPVRQSSGLLTASFRFHLTVDTLAVQLSPSHCRAGSGLSPYRTCARRAHIKNPPGSQEDFRTKNSCFPSLGLSRSGIKGQQQFPPANIKIFNYFSATSFIPDAAFAALRTYYPDPDCKNTAFCQTTELLCLLDGSLSSSQTCDRHTIR